jgi:flavin reductase (DIM6/NTAB) family NADH-FMN oxidoreductase RutF
MLGTNRLRIGHPSTIHFSSMICSKPSTMPSKSPNSTEFRHALAQFATGVTVITAERTPGKVHGMTANSFTSVSLDPLLLLICVAQNAQLLPMLKAKKSFGVNVLRQEQEAISRYFAQTEDLPQVETELGIRYRWTSSGIPLLEAALVHLACNVVSSYIAGDHTVFIGEVESIEVYDGEPLLYFRRDYHKIGE